MDMPDWRAFEEVTCEGMAAGSHGRQTPGRKC